MNASNEEVHFESRVGRNDEVSSIVFLDDNGRLRLDPV